MSSITLTKVTKAFEDGTLAVDALDLHVDDGEFMVLVGPSGCGKTTSLRMVAGLEDPTDGEIRIGEQVVNDLPSRSRDIAMVFQNYALYPHMSIAENLVFGLRMQGLGKHDRRKRAEEVAEILAISDLLDRRPKQLSGGQRQRVAMGRAIVREPRAFLMDEPLSNLDAKLRVQMRAEIARIQRRLGTTTLYVTHDQIEAMTMADRVAVMDRGVLQQVATPAGLYDRPDNLFVAGFIGTPPMNLFKTVIVGGDTGACLQLGSQSLEIGARPERDGWVGRELVVGIRAEDIEDAALAGPLSPRQRLRVDVDLVEHLGSDLLVHATIDAVNASSSRVLDPAEQTLPVAGSSGRGRIVARCNPRSRVTAGDSVDLAIDVDRLHLFDPLDESRIAE
jgi:multiple sugar transport system ATP-binding protein